VDTIGKIALALVVLTGAGMILKNTSGTSDIINTTLSGFQSILSLGSGSGAPVASGGVGSASKQDPAIAGHI